IEPSSREPHCAQANRVSGAVPRMPLEHLARQWNDALRQFVDPEQAGALSLPHGVSGPFGRGVDREEPVPRRYPPELRVALHLPQQAPAREREAELFQDLAAHAHLRYLIRLEPAPEQRPHAWIGYAGNVVPELKDVGPAHQDDRVGKLHRTVRNGIQWRSRGSAGAAVRPVTRSAGDSTVDREARYPATATSSVKRIRSRPRMLPRGDRWIT